MDHTSYLASKLSAIYVEQGPENSVSLTQYLLTYNNNSVNQHLASLAGRLATSAN
jgi:hypothetical protein